MDFRRPSEQGSVSNEKTFDNSNVKLLYGDHRQRNLSYTNNKIVIEGASTDVRKLATMDFIIRLLKLLLFGAIVIIAAVKGTAVFDGASLLKAFGFSP